MKRNILQRGFTLIELLVVVAIIGILSSIVLVSLNSARAKGRDASAKGSLSSIRAAAEIYYDNNNNSYAGMCGDLSITSLLEAANRQTGNLQDCDDTSSPHSYTAGIILNNENYFCVDATGYAGEFDAGGAPLSAPSSSGDSCLN